MVTNPMNQGQQMLQLLIFQLAGHSFGFKMLDLSAVTRFLEITPVARSADFFEGLINLRGKLTPVINLRTLFCLPPKKHDSKTRLLALKGEGYNLCVVVDKIEKVFSVGVGQLEQPPKILYNDYIDTVYKLDEQLIFVINSQKLVDPDEVKSIIEAPEKREMLLEASKSEATS